MRILVVMKPEPADSKREVYLKRILKSSKTGKESATYLVEFYNFLMRILPESWLFTLGISRIVCRVDQGKSGRDSLSFCMAFYIQNLMFQVLTPYPVGITINGANCW